MKKQPFVAGWVLVAAALWGGPAAAQQSTATEIAGGRGGSAFLDAEPAPGARVVEVQVRSGEYVDSVQLVYMLRDGRVVTGPRRGGEGGRLDVFHLDADEYLTGVSGRYGSHIDSIRFHTNKRTSPTYGGRGGDGNFRVDIPPNGRGTGLAGRAGEYLDAIGLMWAPMRRGVGNQTALAGGSGGVEFADEDVPPGARVAEVRVWAGGVIDSVQMVYALPNGREIEGARHGGRGGRAASFRLQPGEYIIGLSGRHGAQVDSLRIHTNRRTSPLFGGRGGNREYRIEVPNGNEATGFAGRAGQYLDAIGLTYERIRPQRGFGGRPRGR